MATRQKRFRPRPGIEIVLRAPGALKVDDQWKDVGVTRITEILYQLTVGCQKMFFYESDRQSLVSLLRDAGELP